MDPAKRLLQRIGEALEHLVEKGEFEGVEQAQAISPQTRGTDIKEVDQLEVIIGNDVIVIAAAVTGNHEHQFVLDEEDLDFGTCKSCGAWNDDEGI